MKKLVFLLALVLLLFGGCASDIRIGSVRLIADGVEHEPVAHFLHGLFDRGNLSASGTPFCSWLVQNLWRMPEIPYADNLRIVVRGGAHYGDELRIRGIYVPEDYRGWPYESGEHWAYDWFSIGDERGRITLPEEPGTYLAFVDVEWRGGRDFMRHRYVFRIVR
ncbi:MAG: hypothetical protein FWC72_02570 [Oscillospiraceae bacterium]|nr:hypothetical protein [Oscillospiraceae bacterium]